MKKTKFNITIDHIRELLLVGGFVTFGYGLWLVYPPAMFIVCGAALLWVGLPPRKGGDK